MKRKTTIEFINEAKLVHGTKYDYSLVDYKTNNSNVSFICLVHGEFKQTPSKHLNGQGCAKCSSINVINRYRKPINKFINESKLVHGTKYDYSLVNYKNNRTNVTIICPIHGVFEQTPSNHLNGKGCKYCGGTCGVDKKIFIDKARLIHGNKYDYSLVDYKNSREIVSIICPEHGEFEQTPNNHLSKKQGCLKCLGNIIDTKSFINYCSIKHKGKYDYSLVDYKLITDKVIIICPEHGEFEQRCDSHRNGNGCKKCSNNGISIYEQEISDYIRNFNISLTNNSRDIIKPLELDIFIPSHNIAIEFNGLYWHSEEYIQNNYHLEKTELCESNGIQLIQIFEDEWINKKDIVKSRLKNILGLTENKIYARKCEIKEVKTKDKSSFLNDNHIQGKCNSKINLGLYYNDELVSLMTFGGLRIVLGSKPIKDSYELLRFCNKLDTTVIGGASKLLKYFIKNYQPKEIISYADRRWSSGNLYRNLGFKFIKNTSINYYYIINKNREYRFKYRKDILVKDGYDMNKSEHDIMLSRGIYRIYDCGSKKYCLTN